MFAFYFIAKFADTIYIGLSIPGFRGLSRNNLFPTNVRVIANGLYNISNSLV